MRPQKLEGRRAVRRVLSEQETASSSALILRLRQKHPRSDLGVTLGLVVLDLLSSPRLAVSSRAEQEQEEESLLEQEREQQQRAPQL